MKTIISFLLLVTILGISTLSVKAQTTEPKEGKTKFSIEIDPSTFVFKGYSAHLRIQPKSSNHTLYGLGIYAMDMPSLFVDINKDNTNKGWNIRINKAIGLFSEYHFKEVNRSFFVGAQVGMQQFRIELDGTSGSEKFINTLLMAYRGYTLQPFEFPLYFKFWGGLGYTDKLAGKNTLNEQEYDISPVSVFATLHMGYIFKIRKK